MRFLTSQPITTTGYLLLGMHRSGTSCLAGLLETAGLWLADASHKSRVANRRGTFERPVVNSINDAILKQFGGSWQSPPSAIDFSRVRSGPVRRALKPLGQRDNWLMKDPRLVLTLEAWLSHLPRARLLGSFRHPAAVAHSLHRRNHIAMKEGLELWITYNRELVRHHRQRPFPLVNFDLPPDSYLVQFDRLCRTLELPFDERAVMQFYNRDLIDQTGNWDFQISPEAIDMLDYLVSHQLPPA